MAVYDNTVKELGLNIRAGLEALASRKSVTYNVIVIAGNATDDELAAKVQETLERTQAREAAIGKADLDQ